MPTLLLVLVDRVQIRIPLIPVGKRFFKKSVTKNFNSGFLVAPQLWQEALAQACTGTQLASCKTLGIRASRDKLIERANVAHCSVVLERGLGRVRGPRRFRAIVGPAGSLDRFHFAVGLPAN